MIVLDGAQQKEVSELLLSIARWCLYGANYRGRSSVTGEWAISASRDALSYLGTALKERREKGRAPDTLTRQMKSSYAGLLSQVEVDTDDAYERALADKQLCAILIEAKGFAKGELLWYDVIKGWPADVAVDMGTAWNLLPGSDAIPIAEDIAVRSKMTAPRAYDEFEMSKFLRYCATVMTAHILTKEGSRKWTWVNAPEDIEDHEWVKSWLQSWCAIVSP